MKTNLVNFLLIFFLTVFASLSLNSQVVQWFTKGGGTNDDNASGIVADNQGNLYAIGTFSGTAVFGTYSLASTGKTDVFITKTSAATGSVSWAKKLGSQGEDYGYAIATDANGDVYCTGRFSGTITVATASYVAVGGYEAFVAKIDPATGAISWYRKMGGTGIDSGNGIAADASGNVYTTGYFQGMATFGTTTLSPMGNNFNVFVQKTDAATGDVIWAIALGGSGYNFGNALCSDGSGNVYITGSMEGNAVFGSYTLTSAGNTDIFIAKLDTTGEVLMAERFGASGNDSGLDIISKTGGEIYTSGKFEETVVFGTDTLVSKGSSDGFTIKQNSAGDVMWANGIGGTGYDVSAALSYDAFGNIYTTGQFANVIIMNGITFYANGIADCYIARINDATGKTNFGLQGGGSGGDMATGMTRDAAGDVYVTGGFQLAGTFEGNTLIAAGGNDVFSLKINVSVVGIEENELLQNSFHVFPNPFSEELHLSLGNTDLSIYSVSISDVSGRILLQCNAGNLERSVPGHLQSGIYFLTLSDQTHPLLVKKIIKN